MTDATPEPVAPAASPLAARFGRNLEAVWARLRRHRFPVSAELRSRRWKMLIAGAAVTLVLVVLAVAFLDAEAIRWASRLPAPAKRFFEEVTRWGRSDWMLIPTGVICIVLVAGNWRCADRRSAAAWAEIGALVLFFFVAVAGAGLLTDLIKWLVARSRPVLMNRDGILAFSPVAFDYAHVSFPSGHATNVAAATAALRLIRRPLTIPAFLIALLISVSRVEVRAHYPSDVIAGFAIGLGFAWWMAILFARSGLGFRLAPDGEIRPQTFALRGVLRRKGGWARLGTGFASAMAGKSAEPKTGS